jgi:hypothetical protein
MIRKVRIMENELEIKISGKRGAGKAMLVSVIMSSLTNDFSHIFIVGDYYADCKDYAMVELPRSHFIEYSKLCTTQRIKESAKSIKQMTGNEEQAYCFRPKENYYYYLIIEMCNDACKDEVAMRLVKEINSTNIIPVVVSLINENKWIRKMNDLSNNSGFQFGKNSLNDSMGIPNSKDMKNGNGIILGRPGPGKMYCGIGGGCSTMIDTNSGGEYGIRFSSPDGSIVLTREQLINEFRLCLEKETFTLDDVLKE